MWVVDTVELLLSGGPWVCRWLKVDIHCTDLHTYDYDTVPTYRLQYGVLLAIRCTGHGTMGDVAAPLSPGL